MRAYVYHEWHTIMIAIKQYHETGQCEARDTLIDRLTLHGHSVTLDNGRYVCEGDDGTILPHEQLRRKDRG